MEAVGSQAATGRSF